MGSFIRQVLSRAASFPCYTNICLPRERKASVYCKVYLKRWFPIYHSAIGEITTFTFFFFFFFSDFEMVSEFGEHCYASSKCQGALATQLFTFAEKRGWDGSNADKATQYWTHCTRDTWKVVRTWKAVHLLKSHTPLGSQDSDVSDQYGSFPSPWNGMNANFIKTVLYWCLHSIQPCAQL